MRITKRKINNIIKQMVIEEAASRGKKVNITKRELKSLIFENFVLNENETKTYETADLNRKLTFNNDKSLSLNSTEFHEIFPITGTGQPATEAAENTGYSVIYNDTSKKIKDAYFVPNDLRDNPYLYKVGNVKQGDIQILTTPKGSKLVTLQDLKDLVEKIGKTSFNITAKNFEKPSIKDLSTAISYAVKNLKLTPEQEVFGESRKRRQRRHLNEVESAQALSQMLTTTATPAAEPSSTGDSNTRPDTSKVNTKTEEPSASAPEKSAEFAKFEWLWTDLEKILESIFRWWIKEARDSFEEFEGKNSFCLQDDEEKAAEEWQSVFDKRFKPAIDTYGNKQITSSVDGVKNTLEEIKSYNVTKLEALRDACANEIKDYFQNDVQLYLKKLENVSAQDASSKKIMINFGDELFELGNWFGGLEKSASSQITSKPPAIASAIKNNLNK